MTGNTDMHLLVTDTLKKGRGMDDHHLPQLCNTSPSQRVDQAVDCGLWIVVPLLFNGYAKLLDIGGNWNMLSYTCGDGGG
jgi:hypothetical protein